VKDFDEIQARVVEVFQEFLETLFRVKSNPIKYFYWSETFFETLGGLRLQFFSLTQEEIGFLGPVCDFYFLENESRFHFDDSTFRLSPSIIGFSKLFNDENKSGQKDRYEYVREFVFWDVLNKAQGITENVIECQKKNFLLVYLRYLINHTEKPTYEVFKNYIKYSLTKKGEKCIKKIEGLESRDNKHLLLHLDKLYVLKTAEEKINFVFSKDQGGEKEELRELLDLMGKGAGGYYRGQADSFWELDSSLTREIKYQDNEPELYYDILSLKPDAFVNDGNVYERLITMQHFGMPTRLMDITRNPLVAIFFACNNKQRSKSDGVIFTFNPPKEDFFNFEDDKLKALKCLFDKNRVPDGNEIAFLESINFIKGVAKNQRINNQSGDFIYIGKGENVKDKLAKLPAKIIVIDSKTKEVLLEQLESLNIHGGAVYPDLTHMSNYIKDKYLGSTETVIKPSGPKVYSVAVELDPELTEISLSGSVDFKSFWSSDKEKALDAFSGQIGINKESLKLMIEEVIDTDRAPERIRVAELMKPKPLLKDYKTVVQPIVDEIVEFAKTHS